MISKLSLSAASFLRLNRNNAIRNKFNIRSFSTTEDDGSHNDFKPKKKDISTEMKEVFDLIEKQLQEHDILLFMKGTPSKPQCGFSLQTVRVLNAVGANFSSINVLEYPAVREGIKLYSEWPTIPQLYIKGEFIGGCDIVSTMYKEGELETMLKEKKLISNE